MSGSGGAGVTERVYGTLERRTRARAESPKIALTQAAWQSGGVTENSKPETVYFTISDLVQRLNLTPGKIHRLIEDSYLAAVRVDGVLKVPVEFLQGNEPLPPLRGTLLALQDAGYSGEEAVAWILGENEELGGRPIDSLMAGRKSAVRRATQSLAF